jgi:Abortive infection alpha
MSAPDPTTVGLTLQATAAIGKEAEDFASALLGHPDKTLGTIFGEWARYRIKNLMTITGQGEFTLLNLGLTPQQIPPSLAIPLAEAASLQDDSELQGVWANLLANAGDPRQTNPVLPVFATMLKDLTTREVRFLEGLIEMMAAGPGHHSQLWVDHKTDGFSAWQLMEVCTRAKLFRYPGSRSHVSAAQWKEHEADLLADNRDFEEMMGLLKRNQILEEIMRTKPLDVVTPVARAIETRANSQDINVETETFYKLSVLGAVFLNACRPPQPH